MVGVFVLSLCYPPPTPPPPPPLLSRPPRPESLVMYLALSLMMEQVMAALLPSPMTTPGGREIASVANCIGGKWEHGEQGRAGEAWGVKMNTTERFSTV